MRSSLPLADGEAKRGKGPGGDLLCGCPELQRLRRVLALQDQWVHLEPCLFSAGQTSLLLFFFALSAVKLARTLFFILISFCKSPVSLMCHNLAWSFNSNAPVTITASQMLQASTKSLKSPVVQHKYGAIQANRTAWWWQSPLNVSVNLKHN